MAREDLSPALRDLRENLRVAAHERVDVAGASPLRRRRRVKVAALAFASLCLAGGVATAAHLMAVGEPVDKGRESPQTFRPGSAPRTLVLQTRDPAGGLPWGAAIYESAAGKDCVIVGRVRGSSLGVVEGGVFRPYPADRAGACGDLDRVKSFFATSEFSEPLRRTIVFGRAAPATKRLRISEPEGKRIVTPGAGGAFMLVFEGTSSPLVYTVEAVP